MCATRLLAVDLGASHVACAVLRRGPAASLALEQFAIEPFEMGDPSEREWHERAGAALRAAATRLRFRGPVRIALPGHLALTKSVRTPAIDRAKRSRVVAFEAAQGIPYPLDEVWWDHLVWPEAGRELEILLLAVKREAMASVCAGAAAPGRWLECALPVALALHHAFRFNYPELTEPVLLVSVGARTTHLLASVGERVWIRTVAFGGGNVSQSLAARLGGSWADAEAFKLGASTASDGSTRGALEREALAEAAAQFGGRLQLEIVRSLAALREREPAAERVRIFLTGGGARWSMLPDLLRSKLGAEVERFDALRRVNCPLAAAQAGAFADALAAAVGLAAASPLANSAGTGNLLPLPLQRAATQRRRRSAVCAAAALWMVALLAPIWHFNRIATTARAETSAEAARLTAMRALAQRQRAGLAQLEQARAALGALARVEEAKSYWVRFLADLQERVFAVEDAWVERLVVAAAVPERNGTGREYGDAPAPLRLSLEGQLFASGEETLEKSGERYARAQRLLALLAESPFVIALEEERFDTRRPDRLQFACRLTLRPLAGDPSP